MIVDLDEGELARAAASLNCELVACAAADVTSSEQVEAAAREAVERFGRLDIAFANAGIFGVVASVADYPVDVFERVMAVNVLGSFLLAKHALRVMKPGGSLIINSSVVGLTSDSAISAYATSKHALVGLMRTAAKEMAAKRIRVNSLHPGPTDNEFLDRNRCHRSIARSSERDSMTRCATTGCRPPNTSRSACCVTTTVCRARSWRGGRS